MGLKIAGTVGQTESATRRAASELPAAGATAKVEVPVPAAAPKWQATVATAGSAAAKAEQRLQQLNASLSTAQNNGKLGTAVANLLTGGALGSAGQARDAAVQNVNQLYERLVAKDGGRLSDKSARILEGAIDFAMDSIKNVAEVRSGVVSTTANLATSAVLVAAAVPSGGASIAALATIGAGTKAGLSVSMEGNNYTTSQAASDLVTGGAEGALAGVGSKVGQALAAAKPAATVSKAARHQVLELLDTHTFGAISKSELAALQATRETLKQRVAAGLGNEAGFVSGNDKHLLRLLTQLDQPAFLSRVR